MAEQAAGVGSAVRPATSKLDDLMLSMDVVDTLRHQSSLVERELDGDARDAELLTRLRRIYESQGIEVPDRILLEGVKALKEKRFVYEPPPPGLSRTLAGLWVRRGSVAKVGGALLAAVAALWLAHSALVRWPAERQAEQARIELTETLPASLKARAADIARETREPAALAKADQIAAEGNAALAKGDAAGARSATERLDALLADLRKTYDVTIVARPGEQSGVFRIPDRNQGARNYYLVVEAIGADGKPMPLAIRNEEDGKVETVTKWGVRVPASVYEAVARDKNDDGIIQNKTIGSKRRGSLDVSWAVPVSGGFLTRW